MAALPDINVLLPLVYDAHAHHASALAWFNTIREDDTLVLCRITQLSLLRLLNNPSALGGNTLRGPEVWAAWDALVADRRFRFEEEPEGLARHFRALSLEITRQPNRWQDAYLAAFARAANLELVTFDTGFRSFPDLRLRLLPPAPTAP